MKQGETNRICPGCMERWHAPDSTVWILVARCDKCEGEKLTHLQKWRKKAGAKQ